MADYHVKLPDFHGPLDLLLHLVKRNEVDVRDIPLAVVADQFRTYVEVLQVIDIEWAGDFLVTASMLMEIKSKMLLPRPEELPEDLSEDDPRTDLVKQLLQYKELRDAANRLEERAADQERRLTRGTISDDQLGKPEPPTVKSVELWDLLSAFGRLISEAEELAPATLQDDTPQQVYREQALERIKSAGRLPFRDLFTPPYYRHRLVVVFLALLELIKSGKVAIESGDEANQIWLVAVS